MIINSGISKLIGNTKDGGTNSFSVADWTAEWKERDILDDKYQYGKDQNEKENLKSADEIRNNG